MADKYIQLYLILLGCLLVKACSSISTSSIVLGSRPFYLIDNMDESPLKQELRQCEQGSFYKTDFSIGHRGAPLQFPEHTKESYIAAARMGAGIIECDVTFTKDKALVCRHSQCDLHTTTNILAVDHLAAKCSVPFTPADIENGVTANAKCCTSDITLAEFKQLKGKMDGFNPEAITAAEYMQGTPDWRTELYSAGSTLLTHAESIELFKQLGVKMTPELKAPMVEMPFNGFTQQNYAQKLIEEYKAAGVTPNKVWPQSFNIEDVEYWLSKAPTFAKQAVYLDDRFQYQQFDPQNQSTWSPSMAELADRGINIIAPPLWVLVKLNENGEIVPSKYAIEAKKAGLDMIAWTLERSGPLSTGGGWYYQSVKASTDNDGDVYQLLNVLFKDVGVIGVFSDWPATVSYYASCMKMAASDQ